MNEKNDRALRAIAADGKVRVFTCVTTNLVNEMQRRHQSWPIATAALGRTASIAAMMAMTLKNEERLTLQVKGDGPLGTIMVDANSNGQVRGYVNNPHVHLSANALGKLNVGAAVGKGLLYVMRDMGLKDVYRGSVELQSGEIGDDFTYYFAASEQVPSSVGAGVLVETDNTVVVAGGFIVQLLPGYDNETVAAVEEALLRVPSVTEALQQKSGPDPEDLLHQLLPDAKMLADQSIEFYCECSREKVAQVLYSLGSDELEDILRDRGYVETICHFCNEAYQFSKTEVEDLFE